MKTSPGINPSITGRQARAIATAALIIACVAGCLLPTFAASLPHESLDIWRTVASPTTNTLVDVHFANGLFVSVGRNGAIATSPDGESWTARVSGVTNHLLTVSHEQGRWFVAGGSVILVSADAVSWMSAPVADLPVDGRNFTSLACGNGRFAALAANGVALSLDGLAWSYQERTAPLLESMTFGAGKFVAVRGDFFTGSEVFVSANAVDWVAVTNYGAFLNLHGVTHTGGKFFATGANGYLLASDDGMTWVSAIAVPTCATGCQTVWDVVHGDGIFLLVASGGFRAAQSLPPSGWPEVGPKPCSATALAFGAGGFVAVGGNGCISIPAKVYWTNTLGGDWAGAANWRPNRVPGTSDHAFITADGTYTVNGLGSVASVSMGATSGTQTMDLLGGGILRLGGPASFSSNTVLNVNCALTGPWGVTTAGRMNWLGGSVFPEASLTIHAGGSLAIGGAGMELRGPLTNAGTLTWTAGNISMYDVGWIINLPTGVVDVRTDSLMYWSPIIGIPHFRNAGLLRKSFGAGTAVVGVPFYNTGVVEVHAGRLDLADPKAVSGAIRLQGGSVSSGRVLPLSGLLNGSGPVFGNLMLSGQISPSPWAGRLEVHGNYVQKALGSYNVEIGGALASTSYDQLVVTSNATLAGTVNVVAINGFTPAPGDRFEIMKFASRSGSVAFQGLDIANGIALVPEVSSTNIVLVATSVPLSPSPKLNVARNGDALWVSWPLGYPGFQLHSATNLGVPIQWSPVSLSEPNRTILAPSGPATFFRLVGP